MYIKFGTFWKKKKKKSIAQVFMKLLTQKDVLTYADLKILYIQIHIKIISWKLRILYRKNSRVIQR